MRVFISSLAAIGLAASWTSQAEAQSGKTCDSASFSQLIGSASLVPGAQIKDVSATELKGKRIPGLPPYFPDSGPISACQVEVTYTYPGTNSSDTHVTTWLPPSSETWNGRFVGNGGGGWLCSMGLPSLVPSIEAGFATATTDGGLHGSPFGVDYTLKSPGNPDWLNIDRLGYRAIHEMTVLAKQIVAEFYGRPAQTSYYVGCSTGGRQGLMEASRYPEDYNGYLIGAPAARWNPMVVKSLSETVAMHRLNYFPSECELNALTEAAVEACDELDGRKDGLILRPDLCKFAPSNAVGTPYVDHCDGKGEVRRISEQAARIMQLTIDGPMSSSGYRLGPGYPWGTNLTFGLTSTARTKIDPTTGRRTSEVFPLSKQWVEDYIWHGLQELDLDTLTFDDLEALQRQSTEMHSWRLEPGNDLSRTRDRGAKIIMYHGTEDSIIPVGNSLLKYDDVRRATFPNIRSDEQSLEALQGFFRLYLVPGLAHCRPNPAKNGRVPYVGGNAIRQLMQWVEGGVAPQELMADGLESEADRQALGKVCLWPTVPIWTQGGTHMTCRVEGVAAQLKTRVLELRHLPLMFFEHLPSWLMLTTTEKAWQQGKTQSKPKTEL